MVSKLLNSQAINWLAIALAAVLSGCGMQAPVSGFNPIYPAAAMGMGNSVFNPRPGLEIVTVKSLRPALKWEPHPSHGYSILDDQYVSIDLTKQKNLRYELVVWNTVNGARADVAYRANDLTKHEHTVLAPLEPGRTYFWSVRASLVIDGKRRVTEWTISDWPCIPGLAGKNVLQGNVCGREFARSTGRIHSSHYLRFRTPMS